MINSRRKSINKNPFSPAFTIIELIVVIVVIGILATISVISYPGVRDKVIESTIKSQLTSAADNLKSFRNKNGNYPVTIDCSIADSGVNLCLDPGDDVTYTYRVDDESNPQTFTLYAQSLINNKIYFISDSSTVAEITEIPVEPIKWEQISNGGNDNCAITSYGQAYCWGYNKFGQLGNNSTTDSSVPVVVNTPEVLNNKIVKSISTGGSHTCAIASDNQAYCWGSNNKGQLGNNSTTNSSIPVAVDTSGALSGKIIKSISVGGIHTCVIASDNQVYCWGYNNAGQLGNNSTANSSIPVAVDTSGVLSGKTIKSISTGSLHTCAIASDDQAYCWGSNLFGELGNNGPTVLSIPTNSSIPVAVDTSGVLNNKTIKSISTGSFHTCVIASDDKAYCWGNNSKGQLGNSSTTNSLIPVAINASDVLSNKIIESISPGLETTCVIVSDNQAYCWGGNSYGQLGNNSTTDSLAPIMVYTSGVLSGKTIKSISSNSLTSCAIASDNQAYCWGQNTYGQLGNNTTTNSLVPVQVTYPSS